MSEPLREQDVWNILRAVLTVALIVVAVASMYLLVPEVKQFLLSEIKLSLWEWVGFFAVFYAIPAIWCLVHVFRECKRWNQYELKDDPEVESWFDDEEEDEDE